MPLQLSRADLVLFCGVPEKRYANGGEHRQEVDCLVNYFGKLAIHLRPSPEGADCNGRCRIIRRVVERTEIGHPSIAGFRAVVHSDTLTHVSGTSLLDSFPEVNENAYNRFVQRKAC